MFSVKSAVTLACFCFLSTVMAHGAPFVNRPGAAPHRLPLAVLSVPKRIMKLDALHGSYVRNAPESITRPPARRFPGVHNRPWLTARNAPVAISASPPRRARIFDDLPRESRHRGPTVAVSYLQKAVNLGAALPARRFPGVHNRPWLTARNAPVAISANPPRRARIFDDLPRESLHRGPTGA